jgi:hypothetical protein
MLLTSNWRIPASSSLRAGGYLRRARWRLRGASTDGPAAGASTAATGTSSTDASSTRGDGAWDSTYRRWPPITFLLLIRRQVHRHQRRGESHWSRSWYSSLYYSRHSRRLSLFSFVHAARSYSRRCAVRPAAWARGVGGSDRAAFTFTICGQELSRPTQIRHKNPKRKKKRTHRWGVGEHHE